MDIHQSRTVSAQEDMKVKMDIHQEKMEATIHSIRSNLEETTKHWVEDVLSCVLCKELTEKIDETQVNLLAVKTSLDTRTKSLQETLADTKIDLHEEAWTMKAEIRINQERMEAKIEATRCKFQTQLKEVEAGAERERGIGTSAVKLPKMDGAVQKVSDLRPGKKSCVPGGSQFLIPFKVGPL
jgi:hypothetical protein